MVLGVLLSAKNLGSFFAGVGGVEIAVAVSLMLLAVPSRRTVQIWNEILRGGSMMILAQVLFVAFATAIWFGVSSDVVDLRILLNNLAVIPIVLGIFVARQADLRCVNSATSFAAGIFWTSVALFLASFIFPQLRDLVYFSSHRRFQALFEHPNQFGMVATAIIPIFMLSNFGWPRKAAFTLISLYFVLISGSKFNLIVAIGSIYGIWLLWCFKRYPGVAIAATLISVGVVLVLYSYPEYLYMPLYQVVSLVNPDYAQNFLDFFLRPENSVTYQDRERLWSTAIETGIQNPFTGVGWNGVMPLLGFPHAHNVWLNYFMVFGVFGLLYVAWLHWSLLLTWIKILRSSADGAHNTHIGSWCAAASMLLSTYSSDSMGPVSLLLFFCFLAFALPLRKSRN